MVCAGHVEEGRRLAAATYLKNLLKAQWHQPDFLSSSERGDFRNQLVNSLLRSDPLVLKALNEAVCNDFYPLTVYSIDHCFFVQKTYIENAKQSLGGST